jgi:hypothetical protein
LSPYLLITFSIRAPTSWYSGISTLSGLTLSPKNASDAL